MPKEEIYEILYILSPQLEEAEIDEVHQRVTETITRSGGSIRHENKWGRRRLAYEVQKFREGYYILVEFNGSGQTVKDLLDLIRVEGRIIRHLTTCIPKAKFAEDKRREELAKKRAEEAKNAEEAKKQAEAARAAEEAQKAAEEAHKAAEEASKDAAEPLRADAEEKAAEAPAPASQEAAASPAEPTAEPSREASESKGD